MNEEEQPKRPGPEAGKSDEATTEQMPAGEVGPSPAPSVDPNRRRFLRSSDDRMIAGVAGGLGDYFNIDPIIIRIAFAVSILFGGLGIVAYLAVALFVPSGDGSGAPIATSRGRGVLQVLGIIALVFVAFAGFGALAVAAAFATGLGFGLPVAALVVIIGVALAVFSFRGGSKWLIIPALALTVGVGAAAAADLDLEGGIGNREHRPVSAASIPADGYELGIGRLAVDLRDIDWSPGRVVDLPVRIGAGQAVITVPSDVCVVADAHAGAGELRIAGEHADGAGVDLSTAQGSHATPRIEIDADVDLGQIVVLNDDDAEIDDSHDDWDRGFSREDPAAQARNARACGL